ncbi:hypothetical protein LCGC14_2559000 [marine sediment metagenome]|uniref:Uncharacterized protein n=1 Tax=marine sediment metagenome TaxID=412755 RepID=A0A0F9B8H0_9ZZZZ
MDRKKKEDGIMAIVCDFCDNEEHGCDIREDGGYCDEVVHAGLVILEFVERDNGQS